MDLLEEFAKKALPTKWSGLAAVATLSTASACFWLPEFLQKIGLSIAGIETLWFRLAMVFTVLFVGSLVTLTLVVRTYNNLVIDHATEIESIKKSHSESIARIEQKHTIALEKIVGQSGQAAFPEPNAVNPHGVPYFSAAPNSRKP